MGELKRALIFIFFGLCFINQPGFASSTTAPTAPAEVVLEPSFRLQIDNDAAMHKLIKENKRCIRCHKMERKIKKIPAKKMQGIHASEEFYNNCTACHGIKGKHPKDGASVVIFSEHSPTPLKKQNSQCIACHTPQKLRQSEWTHDVHFKQINCVSCHQLLAPVDPIHDISRKDRIKLCVDCHSSADKSKGEL
ncbi:multiheme c-type cytochrome [Psychromonas ossibalaenae]|uniref:multiheme c-type cytochrome n=1 Tax=Psychromonas ossibalaenae TaxID=444922 RepID=UPI00036800E8|nr:multiheme c-type cytochrome [Psychromonas ossibalaenae]